MYDLLLRYKLRSPKAEYSVANIFKWILMWYNYFDWQNACESIITQYKINADEFYKIVLDKIKTEWEKFDWLLSKLYKENDFVEAIENWFYK
jgi:hypothetical protein